jgi:Protein of unknown function (DUF3592)
MDQTLVLIIGSCFVLVGVATGAFFFYRISQAISSTRWPSVVGELESAEMKEVIYRGRQAHGGPDEASAWVVNFRYAYTVADKQYDGSRVTYSDGINKTMRALHRLEKKYKGESLIQVYYNPRNPKQSVLVPGLSLFNFTPLITSTLFVLAGLFIYSLDV